MLSGGNVTRLPSAIITLMLLLSALALMAGSSAGQAVEIDFTSIRDHGVDTDGNDLYNGLVIEVFLNVTHTGQYTVYCRLLVEVSGNDVDISYVVEDPVDLIEDQSNMVDLVIPSEDIYAGEISGVYRADIEVQPHDDPGKWTITHYTKLYDYRQFESGQAPPVLPPDPPDIEQEEGYINITTSAFQVFVNRTSPQVVYRYLEERPGLPHFMVTYSRLVFFDDDGDRIFDGDTVVASVLLTNYPWVVSNILVSGPRVTFDLKTVVTVPVGERFVSAPLWLTFTVTNGSVIDPDESPWIRGDAAELKVDFRMDLEEAIPGADHVCLGSEVTDSLGNQDFMVQEPVGYRLYVRNVETDYLPVPRIPGSRETVVGQVSEHLVWLAYQGWMNSAEETNAGGESSVQVEVRGSFRIKGGQMELYMTYPYNEDLEMLYHDPSLGVISENLPQEEVPTFPDEGPEPNIYMFFFALIVGAVILILTVYARAQGY
jgi:hypothetical protein